MKNKNDISRLVWCLLIIIFIIPLANGCNSSDDKKVEKNSYDLKQESLIKATYNHLGDSKTGSIYCTLSDGREYEVNLTATVAFDSSEFKNFIDKQLQSGQTVYLERTDNLETNVLERNIWLKKPAKVSYDTDNIDESTAADYLLQALLVKNGISSVVNDRNNYQDFLYDLETNAMRNKAGEYAKWNTNTLNNELNTRNGN